jgi:hypothetical protein
MPTSRRHVRFALFAALASLASACVEPEEDDDEGGVMCGDQKCDDLGTIGQELAKINDPIAVWLRDQVDEKGEIDVAYIAMLEGVAKQQGCDRASIDSYVISDDLVGMAGTPFPRVVNTVCSADRAKADLAFFALSFADAQNVDVDPRRIEMFAWDTTTLSYRFYKGEPVAGSPTKVAITLDPAECKECHLQPEHIEGLPMPMTPIMNELSAPWEHWFAEPVSFNHSVAATTENAPTYKSLLEFRKSAARLEQTIRSAYTQRVATARLRLRRDPANVEQAMSLLRPLFCDEQLTYVTEDGSSGLLSANALVDEGLASVYFTIKGTGWPWEWWQDKTMRFQPTDASGLLTMVPTRGAATIAYEKQILSLRVLTTEQVLRIRALDWGTPTMSSFRCDLWHNALPRVTSSTFTGAKNSDIMAPLVEEILTLHKGDFGIGGIDLPAKVPLVAGAGKVISFATADEASIQQLADLVATGMISTSTCEADGTGICLTDSNALGGMIETRFKAAETAGRDPLMPIRNARACEAQMKYPNAPAIPDTGC